MFSLFQFKSTRARENSHFSNRNFYKDDIFEDDPFIGYDQEYHQQARRKPKNPFRDRRALFEEDEEQEEAEFFDFYRDLFEHRVRRCF
jgi:hypothetical protein